MNRRASVARDTPTAAAITGHGELERPDGCVLRIRPGRRLVTFGLGMPLLRLIRDPLNAAGAVELPVAAA